MNVLMIGVDETSIGGMLTVVNNYKNNKEFCEMTNLKYIATVIRSNKLVKIKTFLCKIPEIISTIRNDKMFMFIWQNGAVCLEKDLLFYWQMSWDAKLLFICMEQI